MSLRTKPRAAMVHTRRLLRPARTYVDWMSSRRDGADLSVFHEFVPPPYGGGNQFLRALVARARSAAASTSSRTGSRAATPACLFNSFNFDFAPAAAFRARRRAHGASRRRADRRLSRLRRRHRRPDSSRSTGSSPTRPIFQSRYSLEKHRELGLDAARPGRDPQRGRPGDLSSRRGRAGSRRSPRCGSSRRAGRTTRAREPTCSTWLDAQSRPRLASS